MHCLLPPGVLFVCNRVRFGKLVLLLLIQVGGLGISDICRTVATLAIHTNSSLKSDLLLKMLWVRQHISLYLQVVCNTTFFWIFWGLSPSILHFPGQSCRSQTIDKSVLLSFHAVSAFFPGWGFLYNEEQCEMNPSYSVSITPSILFSIVSVGGMGTPKSASTWRYSRD